MTKPEDLDEDDGLTAFRQMLSDLSQHRDRRIIDPRIVIDNVYGFCPVQAEGFIDGVPFYFRARWDSWRIGIGGDVVMNPDWSHEEDYGEALGDAGWMPVAEAESFIEREALRYLAGEPTDTPKPAPTEEQIMADIEAMRELSKKTMKDLGLDKGEPE